MNNTSNTTNIITINTDNQENNSIVYGLTTEGEIIEFEKVADLPQRNVFINKKLKLIVDRTDGVIRSLNYKTMRLTEIFGTIVAFGTKDDYAALENCRSKAEYKLVA